MDEYAIPPITPGFIDSELPAVKQDEQIELREQTQIGAIGNSPGWDLLKEKIEEKIAVYRFNSALLHKEQPADEFKIRLTVDAMVADELTELLEWVENGIRASQSAADERRTDN